MSPIRHGTRVAPISPTPVQDDSANLSVSDSQVSARLSRDQWFVEEVLACEARLMAYLRRNAATIVGADEISDLRQEVYVRVYEAAANGVPEQTAAFVLTTARHLLIDRVRRAERMALESTDAPGFLEPASNAPTPEHEVGSRQEFKLLTDAMRALPEACRQVVALRKVEGLSQRDVARHLGIAEATVERQVSKGMRLLADRLLSGGVTLGLGLWAKRAAQRASIASLAMVSTQITSTTDDE